MIYHSRFDKMLRCGVSCRYTVLLINCLSLQLLIYNANCMGIHTRQIELPRENEISEDADITQASRPSISVLTITTNISNRYALTEIMSHVKNPANESQLYEFGVVLPEHSFMSAFSMETGGKMYDAYVKQKKLARTEYEEAVAEGRSAAHVSARDSNVFQVSLHVEPRSKAIFRLKYEELLDRRHGYYELLLNLRPGQIIDDFNIRVHINESRPLRFVRVPILKSPGDEVQKNSLSENEPDAVVNVNGNVANVAFRPDRMRQLALAKSDHQQQGVITQFILQYDVDRSKEGAGGEVFVKDGYFVHFFAAQHTKQTLPQHVIFVLDNSGSMSGRKMEQLKDAMNNILTDLKTDDIFNMVVFTESAAVWNPNGTAFQPVQLKDSVEYGKLEPQLRELDLPYEAAVNTENIVRAKSALDNFGPMGATNIIVGLEVALFLAKRAAETRVSNKFQPLIVFLTDGQPNVGLSDANEIISTVTAVNTMNAAIFSLSFGRGADKAFLRDLSDKNLGLSRHIYEASDASIQLQQFYQLISSPLLSNITFKYLDSVSNVSRTSYPLFFNGSELVVVGRHDDTIDFEPALVECRTVDGSVNYTAKVNPSKNSLERLWAYITVRQLLKQNQNQDDNDTMEKALQLSLQYSFVTDITSMVVVKPGEAATEVSPLSAAAEDGSDFDGAPLVMKAAYSGAVPHTRLYAMSMPKLGAHSYSHLFRQDISQLTVPSSIYSRPINLLLNGNTYEGDAVTISPDNFLPDWMANIVPENVTDPNQVVINGTYFRFGDRSTELSSNVITCPEDVIEHNKGVCVLVYNCIELRYSSLDLDTFLSYTCEVEGYDGICCPHYPMTTAAP